MRVVADAVGFGLAVALALVASSVGRRTETDALPFVQLITAVVAAVVVAAVVGARTHRAIVPLALAAGFTWFAYRWRLDQLTGPLGGPFGYRNASGAFLAVAACAWLTAGAALRRPWWVALCAVPAAIASIAAVRDAFGAAAVVLAWFALVGLAGRRASRAAIMGCGAALAAVLLATILLGATYDPAEGPAGVTSALVRTGLTERRPALWHDAWEALQADPAGAGVNSFASVSPTAQADADSIHAHNEFLERGAELGVAGLVLMVLLFGWAFVRLWMVPHPDAVQALAAASIAVVGVHASVDYILHTPAILLGAAALLGTGLVPRREEIWE
jgi:O-antigen ligase